MLAEQDDVDEGGEEEEEGQGGAGEVEERAERAGECCEGGGAVGGARVVAREVEAEGGSMGLG